jgi:predicted nucleotidyltransferase
VYLQALFHSIGEWAKDKPLVKRVHIFGSRARDDYTPNSDLDLALELDTAEIDGYDESGGLATWMFESDGWESELESRTGFVVQLEQYIDEAQTPTIAQGLRESSLLVYEKSI